jgi:CRP/FNR family transcriptional regulator, cyclic AMP receptor protein
LGQSRSADSKGMNGISNWEHPLWAGLSAAQKETLAQRLVVKTFSPGAVLCKQGSRPSQIILVLKGSLKILFESKNKRSVVMAFQRAPAIAGSLEIFDRVPLLASVVALDACDVVSIPQKEFLLLLHRHHQISVNLSVHLSRLLLQTGRDRRIKVFGSAAQIVGETIRNLAEVFGRPLGERILIDRKISGSEIAGMTGLSRKSIVRAIEGLKRKELVTVSKKQLSVNSISDLFEFCTV